MGAALSAPEARQPSVVLVPPLFEPRARGRSRHARSAFDAAFGWPALGRLFGDYLSAAAGGAGGAGGGGRGALAARLAFSPPEDGRVSVAAKLRAPLGGGGAAAAGGGGGSMALRFTPDPARPQTFVDVRARAAGAAGGGAAAAARVCYFSPGARLAAFAEAPLGAPRSGDAGAAAAAPGARVGLRYTSAGAGVGLIAARAGGAPSQAWALARLGASGLVVGVQVEPPAGLALAPLLAPAAAAAWRGAAAAAAASASWAAAYSPPPSASGARAGTFSAAVGLRRGRELTVAFHQHLALTRRVRNPLEKGDVVGITSYLDIGYRLVADLAPGADAAPGRLDLAAAWQANKNVLLKARLGLDGAAAAVVFRSWNQPSLALGVAVAKDFGGSAPPRFGLTASAETFSTLRYERSPAAHQRSGGAVTQRHVASAADVAAAAGRGLLVPLGEVDNPAVLGQRGPAGADFL